MPEARRVLFEEQQAAFEQEQQTNHELRARVELLTDTNRRLEHLVEELRRAIYEKRSEKRPLDDRQLAFEDLEGAAQAHLIEGGLPTEGTLAQVLISKYADHLPLYRQSQIYARSGVQLDRSTLEAIANGHPASEIDRLLPWAYTPTSS